MLVYLQLKILPAIMSRVSVPNVCACPSTIENDSRSDCGNWCEWSCSSWINWRFNKRRSAAQMVHFIDCARLLILFVFFRLSFRLGTRWNGSRSFSIVFIYFSTLSFVLWSFVVALFNSYYPHLQISACSRNHRASKKKANNHKVLQMNWFAWICQIILLWNIRTV